MVQAHCKVIIVHDKMCGDQALREGRTAVADVAALLLVIDALKHHGRMIWSPLVLVVQLGPGCCCSSAADVAHNAAPLQDTPEHIVLTLCRACVPF
jgi:hypothetical protein